MKHANVPMERLESRTLMSGVPLVPAAGHTKVPDQTPAGQSTFVHFKNDVPSTPTPVVPVTPAAPTHVAARPSTPLRIQFDAVSTARPVVTTKIAVPSTHLASQTASSTDNTGLHPKLGSIPHRAHWVPKPKTTTGSHDVGAAAPTHVATKPATPVKAIPVTPTPAPQPIDPATTDPSIRYKSFAGDPLFAPAGPTAADVTQGYVGDCYLMSTLSSIARTDPALIERDVVANGNGTYTVKFAGKSETVNADLPVFPDGQVAYAQLGADDSLWVAVTEKAYAIYVGGKTPSYSAIDGGWMGSVFAAFGLKTTNTFAETNAKALAATIAADLKADDFVTFGSTDTVSATSGFVASHAYDVDSVTESDGVVTGITFRNPWGSNVADDGYLTVTPQQAMAVFGGMAVAHA